VLVKLGFAQSDLRPASKTFLTTGQTLAGGYENTTVQTGRAYTHSGAGRPSLSVRFVEDHAAIIVVRGDLTCALAGLNHWEIAGLTPRAARQLVANSVLAFLPRVAASTQPTTKPTTGPTTAPTTRPTTQPLVTGAAPR
jgi:hypothetical protein